MIKGNNSTVGHLSVPADEVQEIYKRIVIARISELLNCLKLMFKNSIKLV